MKILNYLLHLDLNNTETFDGEIEITLELNGEKSVYLDSIDLTYKEWIFNNENVLFSFQENKVVVHLAQPIFGKIKLYSIYQGKINQQLEGLYQTFYDKENNQYAFGTQFESENCRRVLPCIDVPKEKAIIKLSVSVDKGWQVFSNTDIEHIDKEDRLTYYFYETKPISTYLFAFYVVPINLIDYIIFSNKVPYVGAILPKGKSAQIAGDATVDGVKLMGEILNYDFPLSKIDIVAVPDFSSGAMENWGLITFRDLYILDDDGNTKVGNMRIQEVVLHELGHQWFGNLVTLEKWSSLWMKEGFATWLAYYFGDKLYPQSDFSRKFITSEIENALDDDFLDGTHPLEADDANLNEIYDSLTYSKGATLIHVLYHLIGEDKMIDGLSTYVNTYKYKTTNPRDLIKCLVGNSHYYNKVMKFISSTGYAICYVDNGKITTDKELIFPYLEINDKICKITEEVKLGDIINGHRKNYTRVKYSLPYFNALMKRLPELDQIEIGVLWMDLSFFVYHNHYHIELLLSNIHNFYNVVDDDNKKMIRNTILSYYYLSGKQEWKRKWRQYLFTVPDSLLLQRLGIKRIVSLIVDNEDRYDTFCAYVENGNNPMDLWNIKTESLSVKRDINSAITFTNENYIDKVIELAFSESIRNQDRHIIFINLASNPNIDFYKIMTLHISRLMSMYSPTSHILNHIVEALATYCPQLLLCISEPIKNNNIAAIKRGESIRVKNLLNLKNISKYFLSK